MLKESIAIDTQLYWLTVNMEEFPIRWDTWCKYASTIAERHKGLISRCEEAHQVSISCKEVEARIVARNGGFELQCLNRGLWWQGCSPVYKRVSSCLAYFLKNFESLSIIYNKNKYI